MADNPDLNENHVFNAGAPVAQQGVATPNPAAPGNIPAGYASSVPAGADDAVSIKKKLPDGAGTPEVPAPSAAAAPAGAELPERLKQRYLIEHRGDAAHLFIDRTQADKKMPSIVDGGDRLSTKVNHKDVVRDIIDIAEHRAWKQISVRGTEEFRREAWLEAVSRGIEVKGYKPGELDLQELQRRVAARPDLAIEKLADRTPPIGAGVGAAPALTVAKPNLPEGTAELVEHGRAPYQFDKKNDPSYFAKLRDASGLEVVMWGKDIERALKDSDAKPGDQITLKKGDRQPVTVNTSERDEAGNPIRPVTKDALRNEWQATVFSKHGPNDTSVERAARFRIVDQSDSAKHPDLADAFSRLALVKAALTSAGVATGEQERVVGLARAAIAADLESGSSPGKVLVKDDPRNPDLGTKLADSQADLNAMRGEATIGREIRRAEDKAVIAIDDHRQPSAPKTGDEGKGKPDIPAPKIAKR
jgi:hypothetical protein